MIMLGTSNVAQRVDQSHPAFRISDSVLAKICLRTEHPRKGRLSGVAPSSICHLPATMIKPIYHASISP